MSTPYLKRVLYAELDPNIQFAHDQNVKVHREAGRVEFYGDAPYLFGFHRKGFYEGLS